MTRIDNVKVTYLDSKDHREYTTFIGDIILSNDPMIRLEQLKAVIIAGISRGGFL